MTNSPTKTIIDKIFRKLGYVPHNEFKERLYQMMWESAKSVYDL